MSTNSRRVVRWSIIAIAGLGVFQSVTPTANAAKKQSRAATKPSRVAAKPTAAKPTAEASTSASTTTPTRASITVGLFAEPSTMDPALATSDLTLNEITGTIYDTLLDSPIGGLPKPNLAESVTEAPDRRSWTISLRRSISFQDGTPLDAAAVKFNLERQRKSRTYGAQMALITNVTVVDALTVRLDLDKPYAGIPSMLSGTIGMMVSPKSVQEKGDKFGREPGRAGTGPYALVEWVPGDRATVIRNPNYWGDPKPRLEQIKYQVIPDENSRLTALRAGDLQAMTILATSIADRAVESGFKRFDSQLVGSAGFVFNTSKPPFDDVRMRRAVSLAIDAAAVAEFAGDKNFANQGNGLWPKDNPWYAPGEDRRYDRSEARRLANEYIRDTGRDAAFTLQVFGFSPILVDVARLQAKMIQDAGIDAKIDVKVDPQAAAGAVFAGQFEATQWSFNLDRDPDATAFPVLFSASPINVARYKNSEMDLALADGRTAANPEARKTAYAKVQALTRRDVPFTVGSLGRVALLYSPKLCGMSNVGGFPARTAGVGNC